MTQIEITFLGTTAGVPTKFRNHAAIHLMYRSQEEYCCLLDCGEGTQRQIFSSGLNFMRLDDIFITHWHADHFAGLLGLIETMNLENRTAPLNIYGPEAEKFVDILLSLGYSTKQFSVVGKNVEYNGSSIETVMDRDEFYIASIPVKHGIPAVAYAFMEKDRVKIDREKANALGLPSKGPIFKQIKDKGSALYKDMKIKLEDVSFTEKGKKVVYSGDTMPCKNIVKLAESADLLIHDSTHFEDSEEFKSRAKESKEYRHTTFEDVLKISEEARAKQLIITHISRRYQDIQDLKDKIAKYPNVKLAKDFMKIELK
ncbi:MAG: ribonuclease Z [Candidatus Aenigmarchaeota archaeon]|nr:ribonuclease Z [Candidatus Aenigmarchaeota archaeon]